MLAQVLLLMKFWSRWNIIYIWIETSQIIDLTFVKTTLRRLAGTQNVIVVKYFILLSRAAECGWWWSSDLNTMVWSRWLPVTTFLMINNSSPDWLEPPGHTLRLQAKHFSLLLHWERERYTRHLEHFRRWWTQMSRSPNLAGYSVLAVNLPSSSSDPNYKCLELVKFQFKEAANGQKTSSKHSFVFISDLCLNSGGSVVVVWRAPPIWGM